jgi:D-alanine transaminase
VIVHLNGELVPLRRASISPLDRGFIFGDALYEGLRATHGRVIALDRHAARLAAGLAESRIAGFDANSLHGLTRDLLDANGLRDAFIYVQVSRGAPAPGAPVRERVPLGLGAPTVFAYAEPDLAFEAITEPRTTTAVTIPDPRWSRGHIKSSSLMGNVLAVLEAADHDGAEPLLVRDGLASEGAATNLFLSMGGEIHTPALDSAPMLHGVTRALLLEHEPGIVERPVPEADLRDADELMLVGTRTCVASITHLDGRPVGGGASPGPAARRLLAALHRAVEAEMRVPHA